MVVVGKYTAQSKWVGAAVLMGVVMCGVKRKKE